MITLKAVHKLTKQKSNLLNFWKFYHKLQVHKHSTYLISNVNIGLFSK